MGSCVFLNRYSGTFKVKNSEKATEKSLVFNQTVCCYNDCIAGYSQEAAWPLVIDLFWCLSLSVYSPLRIQAYINQLKSKYKMTIDIYIVQASFKDSIQKINPIL